MTDFDSSPADPSEVYELASAALDDELSSSELARASKLEGFNDARSELEATQAAVAEPINAPQATSRQAHLNAAMAVFDSEVRPITRKTPNLAAVAGVASIDEARAKRNRQLTLLSRAAVVVVAVAGLGALASQGFDGSADDSAGSAAESVTSNADASDASDDGDSSAALEAAPAESAEDSGDFDDSAADEGNAIANDEEASALTDKTTVVDRATDDVAARPAIEGDETVATLVTLFEQLQGPPARSACPDMLTPQTTGIVMLKLDNQPVELMFTGDTENPILLLDEPSCEVILN